MAGAEYLDLTQLSALTFEQPDDGRYPGLQLAWETLRGTPGSTCVLNAANEVAVDAFLNRRIRFDQIHHVNMQSLSDCAVPAGAAESVEGLLSLDQLARRMAESVVSGFAR